MKKKILLTLMLIALSIIAFGTISVSAENVESGTCGDNLTWILDDAGVLTISGNGEMYDFEVDGAPWVNHADVIKEVVIEDGISKIGANSFVGYTNLSTVKISDSIEIIGASAFENKKNRNRIEKVYIEDVSKWANIKFGDRYASPLRGSTSLYLNNQLVEEISFDDNVKTISNYAFADCNSIKKVTLNRYITNEYKDWFVGCSKLEQIDVDLENPVYCSVDGNLLSKDLSTFYQYAIAKTETLCVIPKGVKCIKMQAFVKCKNLESVVFNDGILEIEDWAFEACKSIRKIVFPKSIVKIHEGAFYNCNLLQEITYLGTVEDWEKIIIEEENDSLINANVSFGKKEIYTQVSKDGKSFTIIPINVENGKTVILALYNGDKFVEMQSAVYTGETVPFTTTKAYTKAKVMVWDDLKSLKPVCVVENIE